MILEKFAASGWYLIATPSTRYLNGDESKEVLIKAIEEADKECGNCGCEFDALYKRFLDLKALLY